MTEQMSARELLPCPWCASEAVCNGEDGGWAVWCGGADCPVLPISEQFPTAPEAIAAWNRRASLEPVAMPPEPEYWHTARYKVGQRVTTETVVRKSDYDALRAWAARGELSDARIREIAEQWFSKGFGDHYQLMQDACAEAIRQALGESKP